MWQGDEGSYPDRSCGERSIQDRLPTPTSHPKSLSMLEAVAQRLRMTPITQPEISILIRALRQELGLTQEKFAAKLGVTFPTVNRWENKRAKPSPLAMEKIEVLAKQFGKSVLDESTR